MKKTTILSTLILFLTISAEAQLAWGSHLSTSDVPHLIDNSGGFAVNAYEVLPDAITTNGGNAALFPANSVITFYSPDLYGENNGSKTWSNTNDVSAWLIVRAPNSTVQLSKKIQLNNEDYYLRIWSVQYEYRENDNDEILVFTGSMVHKNEVGLSKMIIGTYHINDNNLEILALEQPYSYPGPSGQISSYVASQGIGVRSLNYNSPLKDNYIAIGQTADINVVPIPGHTSQLWDPIHIENAVFPISIIFNVDNLGNITINSNGIEIQDFLFKPHTVTKVVEKIGGNGKSIIVGGMKIETINYPSTVISAAAYTFDISYLAGNWIVDVTDGAYVSTHDYKSNSHSDPFPKVHVIFGNESMTNRSVNIGISSTYSLITPSPLPVIFQYKINPITADYSLNIAKRYSLFAAPTYHNVIGIIKRLTYSPGSSTFDVVLSLDDGYHNAWNRPNETSIGLMEIDRNTIVTNSNFKSIYADDIIGGFETRITNATGIRTNGILYTLADGFGQNTIKTRAHFNYTSTGNFQCEDGGITAGSAPFYISFIDTQQKMELNPPPIIPFDATELEVSTNNWDCYNYDPGVLRKKFSLESKGNIEPLVLKNRENLYKIKNLEENVRNYQLYNIAGQQISLSIQNNEFSLQNMTPGVYIFRYKAKGKNYSEKLVVE